jgi:prevent-host-death family protein
MTTINVHEAKTHLSRLLAQVAGGRHFLIAKSGRPVAQLVPLAAAVRPKRLGLLRGRARLAEHFNATPALGRAGRPR